MQQDVFLLSALICEKARPRDGGRVDFIGVCNHFQASPSGSLTLNGELAMVFARGDLETFVVDVHLVTHDGNPLGKSLQVGLQFRPGALTLGKSVSLTGLPALPVGEYVLAIEIERKNRGFVPFIVHAHDAAAPPPTFH